MAMEISSKYPVPVERTILAKQGRKGDGRQETMCNLKVGESFHLEATPNSACALRWWAKAKLPGRVFTVRKEENGVRIWRTK